jgi:two-component system KDP operon response regulator KdpE
MADLGVLVVEDDPAVAEVLASALDSRGYRVSAAPSGRAALDAASLEAPDLVILDLGLPDIDGVEVCRLLRQWSKNPIIVLSADGAEDRKIAALDEGADDYVTKPFSMPELLARIRVAERHRHLAAQVVDDTVIVLGDVVVDPAARVVSVAGVLVDFTHKEFALLTLLARNPGRVLTHGTILEQVWGTGQGGTQPLRMLVFQLRKKLGTAPGRPSVDSVPGTGYRIVLP